jgi:hypothetical protein
MHLRRANRSIMVGLAILVVILAAIGGTHVVRENLAQRRIDRDFDRAARSCHPNGVLDSFAIPSIGQLRRSKEVVVGILKAPDRLLIDSVVRGGNMRIGQVITVCRGDLNARRAKPGRRVVGFFDARAVDVPDAWILPPNSEGLFLIGSTGTVDMSSAGGSSVTPLRLL